MKVWKPIKILTFTNTSLKNPQCKSICDENCFAILDFARTKYTLKLKESMYIKWLKPSSNKQVKCILYSFRAGKSTPLGRGIFL